MPNSIIELNQREISVISGGASSYREQAMEVMSAVAKYAHQTTEIALAAVGLYITATVVVTTIRLVQRYYSRQRLTVHFWETAHLDVLDNYINNNHIA
jgi:hypothetical protein